VLYLPFSKPSELTQDASWILGSTHGSLGRLAGEFSSAYFSGQLPEWFRGNRKIIERAAKTAWKAAAKANGGKENPNGLSQISSVSTREKHYSKEFRTGISISLASLYLNHNLYISSLLLSSFKLPPRHLILSSTYTFLSPAKHIF